MPRIAAKNRIILNSQLDDFLHNSSRTALQAAYRPNQEGYIEFERRLAMLRLLSYDERRKIASAMTTLKMFRENLLTSYNASIINARNTSNINLRAPAIFRVDRSLPQNSPLRIGLENLNELRNAFSFNDTNEVIKTKMKMFYHDQRRRATGLDVN